VCALLIGFISIDSPKSPIDNPQSKDPPATAGGTDLTAKLTHYFHCIFFTSLGRDRIIPAVTGLAPVRASLAGDFPRLLLSAYPIAASKPG